MTGMKRLEYTIRFVTPTFLGGADQSAQWRTRPFVGSESDSVEGITL